MQHGSDTLLTRLLWNEQLDMAAGMGALREAQRQQELRIGELGSRCDSLERTILTSPLLQPQRPSTAPTSTPASRKDSWTKMASSAPQMWQLAIWLLRQAPKALVAWGIASGWITAAWRWLQQLLPVLLG